MIAGPRLLIRLGSMGDVVLATAAADAWAAQAGGPIDVLVKEEWAPLWRDHPAVRAVVVWPRDARGAGGLLRMAARLRAAGYAACVDLQGSLRTRLLTALSGIPRVRRAQRYELRRRALVRWKRFGPPAGFRMLRSFLDAVAPGAEGVPSLHPDSGAHARAASLVPGGNCLVLVPGARHATKRWPAERFAAVGRRWRGQTGGSVAALFGPDETVARDAFRAAWPREEERSILIEPLPVAFAVLARAAVVLTGDTGLMHAAAALGAPVVALFGPTVGAFGFAPAGGHARVLERTLACRPCSLHGTATCPRSHFRCMLDIPIEEVLAAVCAAVPAPGQMPRRLAP